MALEFEAGWHRVCQTNDFIPDVIAKDYRKELKRHRRKHAFSEGLREFVEAKCPGCGVKGWFKVGPMGRMSHPGCTTWKMATGAYLARVARQVAPALIALPVRVLLNPRETQPVRPAEPPKPSGPICAGCGAPFPEDRRFCPQCGRRRT